MEFNRLVNKIFEEFNPPYDAGRTPKVKPKGKYGTASPILNEPHDTKSISGFKGQKLVYLKRKRKLKSHLNAFLNISV
mgnify:CR=1 FL=1